jgi:hypothetical protein
MKSLESCLEDYESARKYRDELHPEAHLMLMMTVKGGWFARWRSDLKAAKFWKFQNQGFEDDYKSFKRFYQEQHELNDKMGGSASLPIEE